MRVLVLGKTGMLGHVVCTYLEEQGYEVIGTARNDEKYSYDANSNL